MARTKNPTKGPKVTKTGKIGRPTGVAPRVTTNGLPSRQPKKTPVAILGLKTIDYSKRKAKAIPKYIDGIEVIKVELKPKPDTLSIVKVEKKAKSGRKEDKRLKDFYNKKEKDKFLERCSKDRISIYKRIFAKAKILEEKKGRDLSTFSEVELLELYSYINSSSSNSIRNIHSNVIKYMSYCGRNEEDIPRIKSYTLATRCNKVAMEKKVSLKREELLKCIEAYKEDTCYNPSDAFIALAMFEGLNGSEFNEIACLTKSDLYVKDGKCYANITGENPRVLEISTELYRLGKAALKRADRIVLETKSEKGTKNFPLAESNYVIRKVKRVIHDEDTPIKYNSMKKYFDAFRDNSGLGKYYSPKMIVLSGELSMAEQGAEELGISLYEFVKDIELVKQIADRFGANPYTLRNTFMDYVKKQ